MKTKDRKGNSDLGKLTSIICMLPLVSSAKQYKFTGSNNCIYPLDIPLYQLGVMIIMSLCVCFIRSNKISQIHAGCQIISLFVNYNLKYCQVFCSLECREALGHSCVQGSLCCIYLYIQYYYFLYGILLSLYNHALYFVQNIFITCMYMQFQCSCCA